MRKILSAILITLLFAACNSGGSMEGSLYKITSQENNQTLGKSNINIELKRKVNEDTLALIAQEVRSNNLEYERLFIFHYTEGQDTKGIAWATTHYTPNLTISILGSTEIQDKESNTVKFGLTMEERKAIFQESYRLEVEARKKADLKFPLNTNAEVDKNLEKNSEFQSQLNEKARLDLMKKHNISDSIYWEISAEGVKLNWIPPGVY
jgi:hypothetical protein